MKHIILLLSLVIMLLASTTVTATTICVISDVTLSTTQLACDLLSLDLIPTIIDVSPTNSSECVGLLDGEVQMGRNADPLLSPDNTLFNPLYNLDLVFARLIGR